MSTFIVGLIFAAIVGIGAYKTYSDMKNKKCSCGGCGSKDSCGGSCG